MEEFSKKYKIAHACVFTVDGKTLSRTLFPPSKSRIQDISLPALCSLFENPY